MFTDFFEGQIYWAVINMPYNSPNWNPRFSGVQYINKRCASITTIIFTSSSHWQSITMFPQPLTATNLFSVSMELPIWDISYTWNHTMCGLLWLAFFFSPFSFFNTVLVSGVQLSDSTFPYITRCSSQQVHSPYPSPTLPIPHPPPP